MLKYLLFLNNADDDISNNDLECVFYFIKKFEDKKNLENLYFISYSIEKYYNKICKDKNKNIYKYLFNRSKILKQIDDMKKFNLDEKNILILIKDILINEVK